MAPTVTTTTPTGWAADAAYSNWLRAKDIAAQPFQPYPGPLQAAWNEGQSQGYNAVLNGAGVGQPAMQQAQTFATQAGQYQPQPVQAGGYQPHLQGWAGTQAASAGPAHQMVNSQINRGEIADVTAGQFPGANLSQYLNPYTGAVVDTTISQLQRQHNVLQNQANAKAAAAGAFGGSRQAVMNAENNRNYMDTAAQTVAGLNNQNFAQAQAAIAADQNRALQAGLANQGVSWNVAQANDANRQQAALQNMLAGNEMARYNAGNQQQANMASAAAQNAAMAAHGQAYNRAGEFNADQNLRAQLANQQAGQDAANSRISAANALNGMGLDQQTHLLNAARGQFDMGQARTAFDQAGVDNAYNQWAARQNYPMTQLGILQQGLNGYSSGTQTVSPGQSSNRAANVLAGALGGGQLGYSLGGGLSGWTGLGAGAGALLGMFG